MARDEAYQEAERRIEAARQEESTTLDLSEMGLAEVPEAIASLAQLKSLNLSGNQLTELPESIASLAQLQSLELSDNQLTELPPPILSLTQLKTLNLTKNQLTGLPNGLSALTQLKYLGLGYLAGGNPLITFPTCLRQMKRLVRLWAYQCELKIVPDWIGELTSLIEPI